MMLLMVQKWLENDAPININTAELIFRITGHSFLPPDRVFGQINKIVCKKNQYNST